MTAGLSGLLSSGELPLGFVLVFGPLGLDDIRVGKSPQADYVNIRPLSANYK